MTLYLVDYHTHSKCSPDSTARLADMVQAARRAGLKELCTTDHCDLIQPGGSTFKGQILRGLRSGKITKDDIRRCCANVVKLILDSAIQKEYIG